MMVTPDEQVNHRLHESPSAGRPVPAPRDAARTRARILAAAQQVFSTRGYAQAGMRDIAAAAGINVALVARYFGPKEKLFEAALDATLAEGALLASPRETFGESIVHMLFDEQSGRPNPLPMLMQASSDPVAQGVATTLLRARIAEPLAVWLGEPDGEVRAAEILALTAGVFIYRIMLPMEPFSGSLDPAARRWLEGALQDIVDGRRQSP
jgi:AcrR family transcriptional regulator